MTRGITVPTVISKPSITEKAKQTLINFLPAVLDSNLLADLPSNIKFMKEEKIEGITSYWDTKEYGTVKAVFIVSSSQNDIDSFNFAFHKTHSQPLSAKVAEVLTPKTFLATPKGEWNCANIPDNPRLYCENFWEEENGTRRGVGLLGYHPDSKSKKSTIFFVNITKTVSHTPGKAVLLNSRKPA